MELYDFGKSCDVFSFRKLENAMSALDQESSILLYACTGQYGYSNETNYI